MPHLQPALIPHLIVDRAAEAIDFYKRAFGFEERFRMPGPGGKIMHAELNLDGIVLMLAEEFDMPGGQGTTCKSPKSLGGTAVTLHLNSPNVDAAFDRAVKAGATVSMPVSDMFWGDRYGKLIDPFGHHWSISTHKEDLTPDQIKQRFADMMKNKQH